MEGQVWSRGGVELWGGVAGMVWGVYKEGVGGSCVPSLIGHLASVDVKQHESKGSCVCVCVCVCA